MRNDLHEVGFVVAVVLPNILGVVELVVLPNILGVVVAAGVVPNILGVADGVDPNIFGVVVDAVVLPNIPGVVVAPKGFADGAADDAVAPKGLAVVDVVAPAVNRDEVVDGVVVALNYMLYMRNTPEDRIGIAL